MRGNSRQSNEGGFTLLEILVVLLILSTTALIVVPQLTTMSSSLAFALNREIVEQMLNGLSYQAYRDNQDMVLSGEYTDKGRVIGSEKRSDSGDTFDGRLLTRNLIATPIQHLPPLNPFFYVPQLPDGWRMTVNDPIYFRGSGYCTGGQVEIDVGARQYTYNLAPPLCHATLAE